MKKSTLFLIAAFVVLMALLSAWPLPAQTGSPLAQLAASMQPGEWRPFTPPGWDGSLDPPCQPQGGDPTKPCFQSGVLSPRNLGPLVSISDYITQYADSAAWARGRLTFVGQAHGAVSPGQVVVFDEAANTVRYGPWPSGECQVGDITGAACFGHGYDHTTADPATGDVYYQRNGSTRVYRWPFGTSAWVRLPDIPSQSYSFDGSLKFVPGFGLVFINTDWGVFRCTMPCSTPSDWSLIANTSVTLDASLPKVGAMPIAWSDYSPQHGKLFFGSTTFLWALDATTGHFTRLMDAPKKLGVNYTLQTIAPNSGNLLSLVADEMFEYDPLINNWLKVETVIPFSSPGDGTVEVLIPEYGVNMFLKYGYGNLPIWIYKPGGSSIPVPPPVLEPPLPAPKTPADFVTRCSDPAVFKCVGFDNQADIAGQHGDNHGIFSGSKTFPTLDTINKASGASSLRFIIPSESDAESSGAWFTNMSEDLATQFGAGEKFFYQFRLWMTPAMLQTFNGGGGFKLAIVGTGDKPGGVLAASCTDLETVVNTYASRGFPILYNSCSGSTSHGAYDGLYAFSSTLNDWVLQNAMPSPYCLLGNSSGCFKYTAGEWMTLQVGVYVGPKRVADEWPNSWVRLWMAREGQPQQLVVNFGPYPLTAGPLAEDQRFGKLWLLPFNTGKDPSQVHAEAQLNFDELVMSREFIADPALSGPQPPPVNQPPTCAAIPNQTVTPPAAATLTASCSDDGLPSGHLTGQWSGAGVTFGTPQAATTTATAPVGTYSVSYVASDGALSTTRTMTLTVQESAPGPIAPSIALTASPSTILAGEVAALNWSSLNAATVSISGIGGVPLNGNAQVLPTVTTTYIATATGTGGTATSSATVIVTDGDPVPPQQGDIVAPSVSFKTTDGSTFSGNTKTIEFRASDNVGVVLCEPTVNGIKIQTTPIFTEGAKLPATIKFYLQQATIPKGTYILGVSCKDAAGNTGTAQTVSVTRK